MNPQEKAKSIYNDYYLMILATGEELSQEITISILAKKSALIAVNRIIFESAEIDKYWEKVKLEIEKL
jgi:hypothetical protein